MHEASELNYFHFLAQGHGKDQCAGDCFWSWSIEGKCLSYWGAYREELEAFHYAIDATTNLMMAAPTVETCREYSGFVCKVGLTNPCYADKGSLHARKVQFFEHCSKSL